MAEPCVFCEIVAGREPAEVVMEWEGAIAIVPLNPVTPGHLLVLPKRHTPDALHSPWATGETMARAAMFAEEPCNLITSVGTEATQTVRHMHVHIVPRHAGDGLKLPWSVQTKEGEVP